MLCPHFGDAIKCIIFQNGFDQDFVMEVAIIKTMVESYMAIVSKTIRDLVPKYVTHHLVDAVSINMFHVRSKLAYSNRYELDHL